MERTGFFSNSIAMIAASIVLVGCTSIGGSTSSQNGNPSSSARDLAVSPEDLPEWITLTDASEEDYIAASAYDLPNINLYERPFNVVETNIVYLYELDILSAGLGCDENYCYAEIELGGVNRDTSQLDGTYCVELDVDIDGRGDYLILAYPGLTADWANGTVTILEDANNDVGGPIPLHPDQNASGLDGYETTLFTVNINTDPNLVWARVSPDSFNVVQFAFKRTLLNGANGFMWGVWASSGNVPIWEQDLNDFFRDVHANISTVWFNNFQLAELSALDNTCRMAYGFTPTGQEPGLCITSQ
jgi:hypothetical protein